MSRFIEDNISRKKSTGTDQLQFSIFFNIINGDFRPSERTNHSVNPATKAALFEIPVATKEDVDEAVSSAKAASHSWSKTTIAERRARLDGFANALELQIPEFAKLNVQETGKPLKYATEEAESGPFWIRGVNKLELADEVIEEPDVKITVRHTPLGVVVAIIPWNYPIQLAIVKLAPALLTGNTVILKPSPFAPYCALKIAELAQQFFPPGVVQGLHGDENLGIWLTSHPDVDKITFTGSIATGKKIMETVSRTLKRLTLELGGNDPAIVCKDITVSDVAQKIAEFAFANSGQVCVAIKRVYVHESVYVEFREAFIKAVNQMQIGDGTQYGIELGPIQNEIQYNRLNGVVEDIRRQDQKVALGGKPEISGGFFIRPMIVDNPSSDSRVVIEEQFGPICPLIPWSSENEVLRFANDTEMGLGASVWTNDVEQSDRIGRQLQAGSVWVNTHMWSAPHIPFGGVKQSGFGVEGGKDGLKAFCNVQTLIVQK